MIDIALFRDHSHCDSWSVKSLKQDLRELARGWVNFAEPCVLFPVVLLP